MSVCLSLYSTPGTSAVAIDNKIEQAMVSKNKFTRQIEQNSNGNDEICWKYIPIAYKPRVFLWNASMNPSSIFIENGRLDYESISLNEINIYLLHIEECFECRSFSLDLMTTSFVCSRWDKFQQKLQMMKPIYTDFIRGNLRWNA